MKQENNENPPQNIGACWNRIGKKDDFMLMKITVKEPGNHTFVLFKNKEKGIGEEAFYDKDPAWYIFPYKPKNSDNNK